MRRVCTGAIAFAVFPNAPTPQRPMENQSRYQTTGRKFSTRLLFHIKGDAGEAVRDQGIRESLPVPPSF
jgi:hypothetical protein